MSKLLMVLVMFSVAGCSNKAIYDNLRLDQRNKCVKEPLPTYFECIERTNKSYEEYERERKEILETQKQMKRENNDDSDSRHQRRYGRLLVSGLRCVKAIVRASEDLPDALRLHALLSVVHASIVNLSDTEGVKVTATL